MTARIYQFPGVKLDERLVPPTLIRTPLTEAERDTLNARTVASLEASGYEVVTDHDAPSFARLLDEARAAHAETQKRKLSILELGDARVRGIENCERCQGRVVAHGGEWWNATFGELHKNVCGDPLYRD